MLNDLTMGQRPQPWKAPSVAMMDTPHSDGCAAIVIDCAGSTFYTDRDHMIRSPCWSHLWRFVGYGRWFKWHGRRTGGRGRCRLSPLYVNMMHVYVLVGSLCRDIFSVCVLTVSSEDCV